MKMTINPFLKRALLFIIATTVLTLTWTHFDLRWINIPSHPIQSSFLNRSDGVYLFNKAEDTLTVPAHRDPLAEILNSRLYVRYGLNRSVSEREKVDLVVVVKSAPLHQTRRDAMRDTWWSYCRNNTKKVQVRCFFFTDRTEHLKTVLDNESRDHLDMVFLPLMKGINFGQVILYQMMWSYVRYDFNYLLLLDDDVFFCMDRFLQELSLLPELNGYIWGYIHCSSLVTWADEGIVMFSKDLVERFILQDPEKIRCSAFGDQTFSLWMEDLGIVANHSHDSRIWHDPPASYVSSLKQEANLCSKYIALHGIYPQDASSFWTRAGNVERVEPLSLYTAVCPHKPKFNWGVFIPKYRREPKLCILNPEWTSTDTENPNAAFPGREINSAN